MTTLEIFFLVQLAVQVIHSIEELVMGFHKNNFLFKMSFRFFLGFEILFTVFWVGVFFLASAGVKEVLLPLFMILMFANGVWHVVWARVERAYVPGLLTSPLHIGIFLYFYFTVLI